MKIEFPVSEQLLMKIEQAVYNNISIDVQLITEEGEEMFIEFMSEDKFLHRSLHND